MRAELYYVIFAFFSALMAVLTALLALSREARAGRVDASMRASYANQPLPRTTNPSKIMPGSL